jgi:hypothetical protein
MLILAMILPFNADGQKLRLKDSLTSSALMHFSDPWSPTERFRLYQDIDFTLSFTNYYYQNRPQGNNANLATLCNHLKYQARITGSGKIIASVAFDHDLGIQYFYDSIIIFQPDENILETRFDTRIDRNFNFSLFSTLTTRIFNSYIPGSDGNGHTVKILGGAFLTPLQWTFSTGIGWALPHLGSLSIGLSSAKLTWVKNNKVYTEQETSVFYGVPKGKGFIFEYGICLHMVADADLLDWIHWNCDMLVFKNYRKPVDMTLKNQVGIRISKVLKTTIQTHLNYENEVSRKIRVENLVSLGLHFDF